ncbi:MAG: paraquat-inducible protein A [Paracoccaceae bacterium]|nr:MAG: paraquat-inducible protein A [Paracoccaceae bacterium]
MPRPALLALTALLAVLFPVAWFAPLMTVKVRLAFWAGGTDLSLITTLQSVWAEDAALGLLLTFAAIVAPTVKVLGTGLLLLRLMSPRVEAVLWHIGRFAMADVFLIAVYAALFKGIDGGTITFGWGLHLFTGCVIGSLLLSLAAAQGHGPAARR